jgi:hypothetical protein
MQLPTPEQVAAGNEIASELIGALIERQMGSLGGEKPARSGKYEPIIKLYIDDKIDSVTAMYLAMQQAAPVQNL